MNYLTSNHKTNAMPAIFSKSKIDAVYKAFMNDDLSRSAIAVKLNMTATEVDTYLTSALKKYSTPSLQYKKDARPAEPVAELFEPEIEVKKHFMRPKAVYSNQVQQGYGVRNFKSLLQQ